MARKLSNWLTAYLKYTANTESSPVFNKWVGLSTVASALRKKTWLDVGRIKVYPNLYIVLVAAPGVARKSQAISYATSLINEVPSIQLSADSGSAQGLMESLSESATYDVLPDGSVLNHASLSVISKEFESFLSNIGGNKMIITLTDLYDADENPWKHKTRQGGTIIIPSVYLNILGATTPDSLATSLSPIVFGGGLASRITFICSAVKAKKVPFPELTNHVVELRKDLIEDLMSISRVIGPFTFTPEAKQFWIDWYMAYEEDSAKRIQKRREFNGWYSRKPVLLQKVSLILNACRDGEQLIQVCDLKEAIKCVEEVELGMGAIVSEAHAVAELQRTSILEDTIRQAKSISEKQLLHLTWREIGDANFDDLVNPLLKEGKVKRGFTGPDGREAIWYHWVD